MLVMVKTTAQGVFDKNKIKGADNFLKGRGRAIDAQLAQPELSNNSFRRERRRSWHARVMTSKSAELVCVGSRNQRFAKFFRYLRRVPIGIEQALVKMTELNRVKAIDFIDQPFPNRTAQQVKGMRRDGEERLTAARAQLPNIIETS